MKGSIVAAAVAVLAGSASARSHQHRHAHDLFQKRGLTTGTPQNQNETCGCTTYWTTVTGPATLYTPPVPPTTSTPPPPPPTSTLSTPATVPTPIAQTCPTPGTYTFPATTVTVTESTTVCGPSTTKVPTGTHTLGGVTTVVTTATTVTCPVATTETKSNGVVTSVIKTTTYVCPAAGTYTIAPVTVTVTKETVVCVPTVTSYAPGTYTAPAVVTTVVETDVVVYCPFTSPAPPAPVKTTQAAPPPAPTKEATPPPAKETKPAPKPQGTVPKLGGGEQWAITYTPYGPGGVCRTASEVSNDIAAIKKSGFSTVRVYSTDCDTLPNVGAACEQQGMKMIIGVFISQPGCDNSNPDVAHQIQAIKNWGKFNLVEMCVVGNEALHNGFCSAQQLVTLIKEVKEVLVSGGCNAPVTTTDTVAAWQGSGVAETLCPNVDVVACNSHAYFNAETTPDQAGPFVKGQLEIVKALCGGKEGYVMESGWPSKCKCNGVACCSPQDQATAISSLKQAIGGSIAFFSHTDDDWKEDGECGCEKHWGCGSLF
ncbi:uncharacterized protein E0L32_003576 [Thyridium curvatum]|uniref:Probable beta-glucosidase btgE n=1 Tax=Thyridium curvatum TaxID=1093900 RepID=A0A507B0L4_9PEZI|nr:uncharacterized protein E0L32_003576 [Thyridium curvatum]TPX16635.1 hypothetical protein E0L32_003576 [Thyridium curvatum]